MKGKGKWAVLLLALGIMFAGCFGSPESSDESAVAAKDNPVLGTWQVTVDPSSNKVEIVPVTLGANSLEPTYSWTNSLVVTDMVNTLSAATVTVGPLAGTAAINLANGHIVPGSERVLKSTCSAGGTGVCKRGTDYIIAYNPGIPGTGGASTAVGTLARTASSAIVDGATVTIQYGYYGANTACTGYGLVGTTFTDCIVIENHTNKVIEKLRSITGMVSIAGPINIGDGVTSTGRSDYPLLQPQTGASYAKPSTTPQPLAGWTAGICYNAWGDWSSNTSPAIEGCKLLPVPTRSGVYYSPSWLDPVCGRSNVETYNFAGTSSKYRFYMQLTGIANNWSPLNNSAYGSTAAEDARFDNVNFSTWRALMAYLVPDGGAALNGTWCNNSTGGITNAKYWFAGSLAPIKPGATSHCGTLIKDPHLPRNTYFALNIGLEYPDTIEKGAKTFWDTYMANGDSPSRNQGVGSFYLWSPGVEILYDYNKLLTFANAQQNTGKLPAGQTQFPGGIVPNASANYRANQSVMPVMSGRWSTMNVLTAASGYILSAQNTGISYTSTNFAFFTTYGPSTAPYITQVTKCIPAAGLPRWAGHWGVAHYNSTCQLVTEGADADLDFWYGMVYFKVRGTALRGDYAFIKFDQTDNNVIVYSWNSNTGVRNIAAVKDDLDQDVNNCTSKTVGRLACPAVATDLNLVIFKGTELPNPALPPGNLMANTSRAGGCSYGDGGNTCGGHQYSVAVVCVQ